MDALADEHDGRYEQWTVELYILVSSFMASYAGWDLEVYYCIRHICAYLLQIMGGIKVARAPAQTKKISLLDTWVVVLLSTCSTVVVLAFTCLSSFVFDSQIFSRLFSISVPNFFKPAPSPPRWQLETVRYPTLPHHQLFQVHHHSNSSCIEIDVGIMYHRHSFHRYQSLNRSFLFQARRCGLRRPDGVSTLTPCEGR
jgi:hypothetical protein